ncbi:GNAT family N-acetyltransferase [Rhodopila sp.]|uniref:GNAT family N-acetyltransferase n=1 Tax=Rhodopila sp. TaxID=2480087 RepID=UPI003D0F6322
MRISRQDQVRMERAHVRAWPALNTAVIDGWLWRASGGGSQRANSVSTIDFTATDTAAAIDAVEARYQEAAMPARFHTYDHTAPAGLANELRDRGYTEAEATLTMFKRLEPTTASPRVECRDVECRDVECRDVECRDVECRDVECRDGTWDEWCDVYLGAISESRRTVNQEILRAIPRPCAFFGNRHNGRIVSTALCVIGFGCAVTECVATRAEARRSGGGRTVMAGVLSWAAHQDADMIGLQVAQANAPAVQLYQSLGFTEGATNRFWFRPNTAPRRPICPG